MALPGNSEAPFTRHPAASPVKRPDSGSSGLIERAQGALHVGPPRRTIGNDDAIFDHNNPQVKEDILKMIIQYLQDEGYDASMMTVQDEANVKINEQVRHRSHFKRIKTAILDGEWAEVEKLVQKTSLKDHKTFLYNVYKEQFLELIDQFEYQKAFTLLTKRLKPLEQVGSQNNDFKNLCYLLTCKCIQDAPLKWEGVAASREKLVEQFSSMLEIENNGFEVTRQEMQQHRLLHMLKQAVRYQIEFSRYHPKVIPNVPTATFVGSGGIHLPGTGLCTDYWRTIHALFFRTPTKQHLRATAAM
eukprot:TRINITY_DN828_c0_g3_i2.p1 TRINITY_DN828_c0_g3~~TRINITY_DN828_c0_g3_i2.p1  ORF type:complete len:336 (-),score=50.75 TRINITY_DN828_c0_g3_i2:732-1637(-)